MNELPITKLTFWSLIDELSGVLGGVHVLVDFHFLKAFKEVNSYTVFKTMLEIESSPSKSLLLL